MQLWLDSTECESAAALNSFPCDAIVISSDQSPPAWASGGCRIIIEDEEGRLKNEDGQTIGRRLSIDDGAGQQDALSMVGLTEYLVITCSDWTMIPLENLVAACTPSPTSLVARVDEVIQLRGAAFALESGVDVLLLPPDTELWPAAEGVVAERMQEQTEATEEEQLLKVGVGVELDRVRVTAVSSVGLGDRVCIDLVELLQPGEGMLLGSSSKALCLVHGETIASEFVPARPFRVNAGPVHSYVMMADGTTRYLSELVAGDMILVVSADGLSRSVTVGRLKIESRPLLLISFVTVEGAEEGQIFLQQAETVRLLQSSGAALSVTNLKEDDLLLGKLGTSGRHLGACIEGQVEER
jgi:3-dehydroquinate synthase II